MAVFRLLSIFISNSFQKSSEIVMVIQIYFRSSDANFKFIDFNLLQIKLALYNDMETRPNKERHRNGTKHH